jgi:hypothetical protein
VQNLLALTVFCWFDSGLDLFWAIDLGSDGAGLVGRAGRRRESPELCSRGGGSPEMAELGPPGVKSTWAWVGAVQHDMRDPPGL